MDQFSAASMNKLIKLTQEITDPNVLLNKFIIFKYNDNELSLSYIYNIDNINIYVYNLYFRDKGIINNFAIININIQHLNSYILQSLNINCYYNIYTF